METTDTILPATDTSGIPYVHMSCDGACTTDGKAGTAWFDGEKYYDLHLPQCSTNNQAEYMGLISLLKHLIKTDFKGRALIMMDSQLVVCQVTGKFRVKKAELVPFYKEATALLSAIDAELRWVSRENPIMNKVDILAKGAARGK